METTELDKQIVHWAVALWTAERGEGIRPTDEGRKIVEFRRKELGDVILKRQCMMVSPQYAEEHFRR